MAFVDELTIQARAGRGGDGVVRWLHLKGKEYSGPAGGNGGRGGSVFIRGVRDVALLSKYTGSKVFTAGRGEDGRNKNQHGADGEDSVIDLPVGSVVTNKETGEVFELLNEGEELQILAGGRGGIGNEHFKSSVNRRPEESTPGQEGQSAEFHIELRLVADAGLIGLPNAGKTSLLNALTRASAKVGAYAFTTLDPNLGALFGFTLADIPGLIEGAGEGKGLGHKFLRHVMRTKVLLHCVSLESNDPRADYQVVRKELERFDHGALSRKPEIIILTKADTRTADEISEVRSLFEAEGKEIIVVSAIDDDLLKECADRLVKIVRTSA